MKDLITPDEALVARPAAHVFWTDADKDRPDVICDRNGSVTLALCKVCGQAEGELEDTCPAAQPEATNDWESQKAAIQQILHPEAPAAQPEAPVTLSGRAALCECWNALPADLRLSDQLKPLWGAIQLCYDAQPEAPAVPAGWVRLAKDGPGVYDPLYLIGPDKPQGYVSGYAPLYAAAPAAPAVQVPPMLTPEQMDDTMDRLGRESGYRRFAHAIIAERDKQWLAACGVRS